MVWLAARRQGPPRCAAVHLDDARFAKDRWRLRLHAGSVTVVIIWHETRRAGGFQPATSDRAPDCRASDALQTGLPLPLGNDMRDKVVKQPLHARAGGSRRASNALCRESSQR